MIEKQMQLLFKKHSDWIKIVNSFGCEKHLAEDLVQEMYIKIQLKLEKGLDISYGDEVNYYYIFKTLRTLFLDLMRKGKNIKRVPVENIKGTDDTIDYEKKYQIILDELEKLYWYDKKVFELINAGESIAQLSRKTGIQYYSLYNTYKKVKERLKKLL
jgi:DNA-directed RNA polymerase specialized sigma24 family protein